MKTLVILMTLSILPVGAAAQESEYQGNSLADWIERTAPDNAVADRREAIRTLRQIGMMRNRRASSAEQQAAANDWIAKEIMPRLSDLLIDRDAGVREEAALALCWMDRRASNDAVLGLIELLQDENSRVRDNAASALSFRGLAAKPALQALVAVVKKDAVPEVRRKAAIALRTGGLKGVESLLGLLDDEDVDVRRAAVSALENRYPGMQPPETPLIALPKLMALVQDESSEVRKSAAIAMARMSNVPLANFAQLLRNEDVEVRHAVGHGLLLGAREGSKELRSELLEFMNNDMEFCQRNAGLLSRAGPESVPILVKLLDDSDPRVRGGAARALGDLGSAAKEAVGPLKRLLTDLTKTPRGEGDRVCHHAATALNRILGDRDYREGLPPQPVDGK